MGTRREARNGDEEKYPPTTWIENGDGKDMGWRGRGAGRHFPPLPHASDISIHPLVFQLWSCTLELQLN